MMMMRRRMNAAAVVVVGVVLLFHEILLYVFLHLSSWHFVSALKHHIFQDKFLFFCLCEIVEKTSYSSCFVASLLQTLLFTAGDAPTAGQGGDLPAAGGAIKDTNESY